MKLGDAAKAVAVSVALGTTIFTGTAGEANDSKSKFDNLISNSSHITQIQQIDSTISKDQAFLKAISSLDDIIDKMVDMDEKKRKMDNIVQSAGKKIKIT